MRDNDMVKIGQKVSCKPYYNLKLFDLEATREVVTGVITYINKPHRWFMVEYGDSSAQRACFSFCDIGQAVNLI